MAEPVTLYETIGGKKTIQKAIGIFKEGSELTLENQQNLVKMISAEIGGPKLVNKGADISALKSHVVAGGLHGIFADVLRSEKLYSNSVMEEVKRSLRSFN